MIAKAITFFGRPCVLACDARCDKAWGINGRPRAFLSKDPDDYAYLADGELGSAPADPGTYEGGHAKPLTAEARLNKWCARECERSTTLSTPDIELALPNLSQRFLNMPHLHRTPESER